MSTTRRAAIFKAHDEICHICGCKIQVGEKWEAEHIVPYAMTRDDSDENLAPAHVSCHSQKSKQDVRKIAKAKRVAAKHSGAYRPKAVLPGSKASKWKRKIDGTVVRRDE